MGSVFTFSHLPILTFLLNFSSLTLGARVASLGLAVFLGPVDAVVAVRVTTDARHVLGHVGRVAAGRRVTTNRLSDDTRVAGSVAAAQTHVFDVNIHAGPREVLNVLARA